MELNTARTPNFENWLKLTFRLIVGDHWEQISLQIVNGDTTYRWCRELIRNSLLHLEHSANNFLSAAVTNIKSEIWHLRSGDFKEPKNLMGGISVWENTFFMACDLVGKLPTVQDKLCALKLATVAGMFGVHEEREVLSLKTKITQVFWQLKDESDNVEILQDVKEAFYIFVDFLSEFEINTDEERVKMGERSTRRGVQWKSPASWCFGDFGDKEGQMEYPMDVLVNDQGDFLVLEQDSIGKKTIQRLQLFNKKGRYQKTLLQRGRDDITGMNGMALDKAGNVAVSLKDERSIGRVNVYDMQGTCVLVVKVLITNPKFPPFFTSVAVDKEGKILVVEHHEMAVHIYDKDGEFVSKFGQGGRGAECSVFENVSYLGVSQNNEIFICDPLRSVRVFNSNGAFLRYFKSAGSIPTHVLVGESEVYGVNREAHALEVYSLHDGKVIRSAGGFGGELGRLWTPLGIAKTPDGLIAVAERESHRIQVLKI